MMTLAAVLCCTTTILAEPVSPSVARQRAAHFLQSKGSQLKNEALRAPRRAMGSTASGETATEASPYYVYNAAGDKGFVVISGDDCVGSNLVLGYSDQGSFNADAIPANMQWWLDAMASQIADMSRLGEKARAVELHADVPYLVTALWDQGSNVYNAQNPYNALCPVTDGLLCLTGCMSTALSQVLYYHRWPQEPLTGELPAYTMPNGRVIDALPPVAFDWDNMVDNYRVSTTEAQQMAVATLMRYCGQMLQLDYTPQVTNGFVFDTDLLVNRFGIDPEVHSVEADEYTPSGWDELIYHELSEGRPLVYVGMSSGGGHAYVVDGYEVHDDGGYYHVNWGWGGEGNGYYKIAVLRPDLSGAGGSSTKDGYNINQAALIGLQPVKTATDSYHRYLMTRVWDSVFDGVHYFGVTNPSYRPASYDVALAEMNADGVADCSLLLGQQTVDITGYSFGGFNTEAHSGSEFYAMPEGVTESLTPGCHKLLFVNRESGTDAPWKPVYGPNCYIEINVDAEGQPADTIFHPQPQLTASVRTIKISGLMQWGVLHTVNSTITNNSADDYNGPLQLTTYLVENNKLTSIVHVSRTGIMIEAGGKADIESYFSVPRPGSYVYVITRNDVDLTNTKLSDIKQQTGYIGHKSATIDDLAFDCQSATYSERTDAQGNPTYALDVTVSNRTSWDYNAALLAQIYKLGDDDIYRPYQFPGVSILYCALRVNSNSQQSVSIKLPDALEPGDYYLQLYIASDFSSRLVSDYFVFAAGPIVVESPTGIDVVDHGSSATPQGPVFDLSGRRVQQPQKGIYLYNGKKYIVK